MNAATPKPARVRQRRVIHTCLVVLLAALATVSIHAFAQQGSNKSANKSTNSQQHPPGANYWHRVNKNVATIPDIPGFGTEGGRPNFGGCDAVDVMEGGACDRSAPPTPPPCNDPNASNRGGALPCVCNAGFKWNGSLCEDTICRDSKATNYGKSLPCEPPCPAGKVPLAGQCVDDPINICLDPIATNYLGDLPCVYGTKPLPICDNPWSKDYGQEGWCEEPCSYDTPIPECRRVGAGAGWECPWNGKWHYVARCQG